MKSLKQIKARVEKATDGPWHQRPASYDFPEVAIGLRLIEIKTSNGDSDAEFIANARTDIPRLIDALEKAIEQRNKLARMVFTTAAETAYVCGERDAELERILNGDKGE